MSKRPGAESCGVLVTVLTVPRWSVVWQTQLRSTVFVREDKALYVDFLGAWKMAQIDSSLVRKWIPCIGVVKGDAIVINGSIIDAPWAHMDNAEIDLLCTFS